MSAACGTGRNLERLPQTRTTNHICYQRYRQTPSDTKCEVPRADVLAVDLGDYRAARKTSQFKGRRASTFKILITSTHAVRRRNLRGTPAVRDKQHFLGDALEATEREVDACKPALNPASNQQQLGSVRFAGRTDGRPWVKSWYEDRLVSGATSRRPGFSRMRMGAWSRWATTTPT